MAAHFSLIIVNPFVNNCLHFFEVHLVLKVLTCFASAKKPA